MIWESIALVGLLDIEHVLDVLVCDMIQLALPLLRQVIQEVIHFHVAVLWDLLELEDGSMEGDLRGLAAALLLFDEIQIFWLGLVSLLFLVWLCILLLSLLLSYLTPDRRKGPGLAYTLEVNWF